MNGLEAKLYLRHWYLSPTLMTANSTANRGLTDVLNSLLSIKQLMDLYEESNQKMGA